MAEHDQPSGRPTPPPTAPSGPAWAGGALPAAAVSTGGTGRKLCPQCGTEYESGINFCPKDGSVLKADYGTVELVGQIIGGRYRIERKLGEGGMGQVYLAEHVKLGRACAIKVMRPALMRDQDAIGRFAREAATAGRISHPNVAAVYDFGETDEGLIYLAMEHVEGTALSAVLASRGRLPAAEAVEIAAQVAAGLNAAHELSIIHRDLKPDNILLSYGRDGRPVVKVVDFGIAKAIQEPGQNLTQTGMVVGTLEYMSPEQLIGEPLDGRSDVYSLGCVLYEMLTGERTFSGPSGAAALTRRLTEPPPHPRARVAEVPEALDAVVVRALARVAADRFATAIELRDALLATVEAPAPTSTPPGAMPTAAPPAPTAAPAAATAAPPAIVPEVAAAATPPAPVPAAATTPAATPAPAGMPAPADAASIPSAPTAAPAATVTAPQTGPEPAAVAPSRAWGPRLAIAAVVVVAIGAGALMVRGRRSPAVAPPTGSPSAASPPAAAATAAAAGGGEPAAAAASPAPVTADQSPSASAAAPTTTQPSTTPSAAPSPAPPATAAAPARAEIRIVGSLPAGAVVMLDGVQVAGRTLSVEPGRHTISVGASGYEVATWRGTLQADEKRSWTPELRRVAEAAAPQPAGPVAPSTLGNPAPQPKTDTAAPTAAPAAPALPGKDALVAAGRRAAEAFVAAINARDIRQLRRAWPGIRSSEDSAWRRFLEAKENASVEARLVTVEAEDVNAGTATVLFPIILTFTNPATGRQIQRPSFEATFLAAGDGWKLATIRPAEGN